MVEIQPASAFRAGRLESSWPPGGQDGAVKFWDGVSGQHTATAKLGPAWVEHLAWHPNAPTLGAATGRKLVLLKPDASLSHAFSRRAQDHLRPGVAALPPLSSSPPPHFGGVAPLEPGEPGRIEDPSPWQRHVQALAWSPEGQMARLRQPGPQRASLDSIRGNPNSR